MKNALHNSRQTVIARKLRRLSAGSRKSRGVCSKSSSRRDRNPRTATTAAAGGGAEANDADVCIFHEPDERFFVGAGFSRSGRYLFIVTGSKTTTGYWTLRAGDLEAEPTVVWPRVDGVEYSVDHAIIAGSDISERQRLRLFGEKIGLAFQLADDLLDLTADAATMGKATGKDAARGKGTLLALHGQAWAEERLEQLVAEAEALLAPYGDRSAILVEAARFIANRRS